MQVQKSTCKRRYFCLWATKKIFSAFLRMNSNSRKTMHRLRRYDVLRYAQYDVNSLRSFMMRSVP